MRYAAAFARRLTCLVSSKIDGIRELIRLGPEAEHDRDAAEALRAEVRALPPLPAGRSGPEQQWIENRAELRRWILTEDPRSFLRWPVIVNSMVVRSGEPYILSVELPAVREAGLLPLLSEDRFGNPRLITGTSSSGNLVHHAYHLLRYEHACGRKISEFADVVEVGAGYGSMARLLHRLTVGKIRTTLVDLPEFSALQRYFLDQIGITATTAQDARQVPPASGTGPRLLIATWSLSEMDIADRNRLLSDLGPFDGYLLAYQDAFHGADNLEYFRSLMTRLEPDIEWKLHQEIKHIPRNRYLFGLRRA